MSKQRDKAVEVRDRLNVMVDEIMAKQDQEAHVVACCLALAIEELEKYLYDGDWTPSVAPYRDDRKFEIPFNEGEDDDDAFTGPPWNRKRTSIFDRYPTLAKLRKTGVKIPQEKPEMENRGMGEWSEWERRAFREGDRMAFIRAVRNKTNCTLRRAREYLDEMKAHFVNIWGIDAKPGDQCPVCASKNVQKVRGSGHPFWCRDCKTQWGRPWSI